MTDDEFIQWWNECRCDKTGTELDAWPREKLREITEARQQFVALAADALNARHVIREFMAYVKCGQVPENAHCVKRAKQLLDTPLP